MGILEEQSKERHLIEQGLLKEDEHPYCEFEGCHVVYNLKDGLWVRWGKDKRFAGWLNELYHLYAEPSALLTNHVTLTDLIVSATGYKEEDDAK